MTVGSGIGPDLLTFPITVDLAAEEALAGLTNGEPLTHGPSIALPPVGNFAPP
ncbi:hypothetical protein GCM10010971_15580 [Silvimonas amylolytica]|uniref:Uncharacterized protein n=1 Tax=Silvimonas amylolytica TaxID=449663 RepID=A0ABQ2PL90_9NEIS|nr:hypothetical protein GCM10010971_15580 [Silvimonas amylolytica]